MPLGSAHRQTQRSQDARKPKLPRASAPLALLVPAEELLAQITPDGLEMHKVAVAAAVAGVLLVLPARGLPEVRHWAELNQDGSPVVVAACERLQSPRRGVLITELGIHVADHVVRKVVAHVQVLKLAVLCQLLEDVLVEVLPRTPPCDNLSSL
jgi:hypothetical protein